MSIYGEMSRYGYILIIDLLAPFPIADARLELGNQNLVPEGRIRIRTHGSLLDAVAQKARRAREKRLLKISQPRCSIFHPCTRIVELDKRYHSHFRTTSSRFGQEVGNKLVRGRRRNENQTCDSNNCNSRRSSVIGLCPAAIGYLS